MDMMNKFDPWILPILLNIHTLICSLFFEICRGVFKSIFIIHRQVKYYSSPLIRLVIQYNIYTSMCNFKTYCSFLINVHHREKPIRILPLLYFPARLVSLQVHFLLLLIATALQHKSFATPTFLVSSMYLRSLSDLYP